MGTHPIFESDFDCLTDYNRQKKCHSPQEQKSSKMQEKQSLMLNNSSHRLWSRSKTTLPPTSAPLKELYFKNAREFDVGSGRKAIAIFVPFPQLKSWQKIQQKVVRELEKKFSGKHIVILAQRRILPKPTRKTKNQKQKRPFSGTLTSVHNAILDDL